MLKLFIKPGIISQVRNISNATSANKILSNFTEIPEYVLATLRSFPSLEPNAVIPVSRHFINVPLRRDILWKAVVHEANAARVGSSNPPGRSEMGYSRKKLLPQKGTGKARVGDRNSPIREDGGRALARNAPNDYTTEIPFKVYSSALKIALSHQYREGRLFIVGGQKPEESFESNVAEFLSDDSVASLQFLQKHNLLKKKLLFIVDKPRPNLQEATKDNKNIDIVSKQFVEVRDILRSQYTVIEYNALIYLANIYGEH